MKKILIAVAVVVAASILTAGVFSPKTAGYWLYTGYKYHKAKDYINADKAFDKTLKFNPKSIAAWNCKGSNYQSQARHAEALDAFNQALAIKALSQTDENAQLQTLILKSQSLLELKRYEDSIITCDEYLGRYHDRNSQDRDRVALNKAVAYGRLGRYKHALAVFDFNGCYRSFLRGYYERARVYSLMRDRDNALADLSSAGNTSYSRYYDDEKPYTYKDLARANKDFEWLWDDTAFISITTKTADELEAQGQELAAQGKYEEAIVRYDEAIRMGYSAYISKGEACLRLGKYDEAIRFFRPRYDRYDDNFRALSGMACAYSLKGDKENALTYLRKAVVMSHWRKSDTRNNPDFKWLWDDAEFRRITR